MRDATRHRIRVLKGRFTRLTSRSIDMCSWGTTQIPAASGRKIAEPDPIRADADQPTLRRPDPEAVKERDRRKPARDHGNPAANTAPEYSFTAMSSIVLMVTGRRQPEPDSGYSTRTGIVAGQAAKSAERCGEPATSRGDT